MKNIPPTTARQVAMLEDEAIFCQNQAAASYRNVGYFLNHKDRKWGLEWALRCQQHGATQSACARVVLFALLGVDQEYCD